MAGSRGDQQRAMLVAICPPDLLEAPEVEPFDQAWARSVYEEIRPLAGRGLQAELLSCELREEISGYLAISVAVPSRAANVRVGDVVCAGFAAVRRGNGTLSIRPRLYRKKCTNGQIVHLGDGEDTIESLASIGPAVRACFSATTFENAVDRFRVAARTKLESPALLLSRAGASTSWDDRVRTAYAGERDPTVWGLINAVTARARSETHLERRFDLEADTERILRAIGAGAIGRRHPRTVATQSAGRMPIPSAS
jgi:hypothetical protein